MFRRARQVCEVALMALPSDRRLLKKGGRKLSKMLVEAFGRLSVLKEQEFSCRFFFWCERRKRKSYQKEKRECRVPCSAEHGNGLRAPCPAPPFEKGGRKLSCKIYVQKVFCLPFFQALSLNYCLCLKTVLRRKFFGLPFFQALSLSYSLYSKTVLSRKFFGLPFFQALSLSYSLYSKTVLRRKFFGLPFFQALSLNYCLCLKTVLRRKFFGLPFFQER